MKFRQTRFWLFAELTDQLEYGVHIYGSPQTQPDFLMAASLYLPETVERSIVHDGSGVAPAVKTDDGGWDTRPHLERIVHVTQDVLTAWAEILDEPGAPAASARMMYLVNQSSASVLTKLAKADRVAKLGPLYSGGWHETDGRVQGYFEVGSGIPSRWEDAIIQGPHISVANPFAKEPKTVVNSNNDWLELDIEAMAQDFVPRTNYKREVLDSSFEESYGSWSRPKSVPILTSKTFRLAIREYVSLIGERTLQPAMIPPGSTHVNVLNSYGFGDAEKLPALATIGASLAGLLADFRVRIMGNGHIYRATFGQLPQLVGHPLQNELLARFVRLNALSQSYHELWTACYSPSWMRVIPVVAPLGQRQAMRSCPRRGITDHR